MKEIDFDELDRAVSSLMNNVPKSNPVKTDDDVTVVTLDTEVAPPPDDTENVTPAAPEEPLVVPPVVLDEPVEETEEEPAIESAAEPIVLTEPTEDLDIAVTTSPTVAPAIQRGRFMDMVRRSPSRSDRQPLATTSSGSRQGVTIQPSKNTTRTMEPVIPMEPTMPSIEQPAEQREDTAQLLNSSVTWELSASPEPTPEHIETPLNTDLPIVDESGPMSFGEPAPLVSPFLPDAKVEKRPLGRSTETTETPQVPEEPEVGAPLTPSLDLTAELSDDDDRPEISSDVDAQLPEQPLPPELGSELLNIETGADTQAMVPTAQPMEVPESMPLSPAIPTSPITVPTSPTVPGGNRPAMITSIPQQYKVQAKSEEAPVSAIYDTASYHQPLAHPAKKKPGWLWVIAILAILLLGAGAGAAVYYFGLI